MTAAWGSRRQRVPTLDGDRPWVDPTTRAEAGKAARKRVPRASHAAFEPTPGREPHRDPRGPGGGPPPPGSCPSATKRMAESPFAYYRGTAAVLAFDLAWTRGRTIIVQASRRC